MFVCCVVRCVLFDVCCFFECLLLRVEVCSLCVVRRLFRCDCRLLVDGCWMLVFACLRFVVHVCVLSVVCCLSCWRVVFVVVCYLFKDCRCLRVVGCCLFGLCCLLFVVFFV